MRRGLVDLPDPGMAPEAEKSCGGVNCITSSRPSAVDTAGHPSNHISMEQTMRGHSKVAAIYREFVDAIAKVRVGPSGTALAPDRQSALARPRGYAFDAPRGHDRAVAEYTAAIRIDPRPLAAFAGRAIV
jgi:hypothetical protein